MTSFNNLVRRSSSDSLPLGGLRMACLNWVNITPKTPPIPAVAYGMGDDTTESSIDSVIDGIVALMIARLIVPSVSPSAGPEIEAIVVLTNVEKVLVVLFVTLLTKDWFSRVLITLD